MRRKITPRVTKTLRKIKTSRVKPRWDNPPSNIILEIVPNFCGEHSCTRKPVECVAPSAGPSPNTGVNDFREDAWKLRYQVVLGSQNSQLQGGCLGIRAPQRLTEQSLIVRAHPLGSFHSPTLGLTLSYHPWLSWSKDQMIFFNNSAISQINLYFDYLHSRFNIQNKNNWQQVDKEATSLASGQGCH